MDSVTVKSSTIFISIGSGTKVYRSMTDVPPLVRKKLTQSLSGMNSATILIADRNGREELARALQGHPSSVKFRVGATAQADAQTTRVNRWWASYGHWLELAGVGALGLGIWLVSIWK